jgi:hemolysin III
MLACVSKVVAAREVESETDQLPAPLVAGLEAARPLMRGWLHLGTAPVALVAGLVLLIFTPTMSMRVAVAIFTLSSATMFTVSAAYHRGSGIWSPRWRRSLQRLDHASIFLIIGGTYTPLALYWLAPAQARVLLTVVWVTSISGLVLRLSWLNAPRWVFGPIYILLGWAAVFYLPSFWANAGPLIVILLVSGGALYSVGALIWAIKWPRLSLRYFGFHELFHAVTIAAFLCHYLAIALTVAAMYR